MLTIIISFMIFLPGIIRGECNQENFKQLENSTKFYLLVEEPMETFQEAKQHCQQQVGGQLLTLPDSATHQSIVKWLSNDTKFENRSIKQEGWWVGLSKMADDDVHKWVDGVEFDKHGEVHLNEEDNHDDKDNVDDNEKEGNESCVMLSADDKILVSQNCTTRRPFVCEAIYPCSPFPTFQIFQNDQPLRNISENGTTVRLEYTDEEIELRCIMQGNTQRLTKVGLSCGKAKNETIYSEELSVSQTFSDVYKMDGQTCECRAILLNGTKRILMHVNVTTAPGLLSRGFGEDDDWELSEETQIYLKDTKSRHVRSEEDQYALDEKEDYLVLVVCATITYVVLTSILVAYSMKGRV